MARADANSHGNRLRSAILCLLAQKYRDLVREVARAGQVERDVCLGGDARNITADLNVRVLLSLRSGTSIKVGFLIAAAVSQMVAITALGDAPAPSLAS
jgi:hypothetical protein